MDISIRNLDPVAVKKIDELAKRKRVSRSEYLRQMINTAAILEGLGEVEDKYGQLVQSLLSVIIDNTQTLEQVKETLLRGDDNG